jgi:hypothetical protein
MSVLNADRYKIEQRPSSVGEYAATFSPREKGFREPSSTNVAGTLRVP